MPFTAESSSITATTVLTTPFDPAYQIPVKCFLDSVLPPLRPGLDVATVVEHLTSHGHKRLRPITQANRWRGCPCDPAQSPRAEKCFHFLGNIVEAIAKAGSSDVVNLTQNFFFSRNPRCINTYANRRGRGFIGMPDACMHRDPNIQFKTMGVVGEYKSTDSEEDRMDVKSIQLIASGISTDI